MNPKVIYETEEHDIQYVKELADEVTNFVAKLVLSVFNGVSENIGVPDPDALASFPPSVILQKGFLDGMKDYAKKVVDYVGRKLPFHSFKIKGMTLYKRNGQILSQKEWDEFEKQLTAYMKPYLPNMNEEMAVKAVLLSMASAEAEAQKEQLHEYGKRSLEQIEKSRFDGYIPDTINEAIKRYKLNKDMQRAILHGYEHAAQYVQSVDDLIRRAIHDQVSKAHRLGLTPQELASNLYWMKKENKDMSKGIFDGRYTAQGILRDWRRVALTETAYIHEAGKMAYNESASRESITHPEKAIYNVFTRGTCQWCSAHHGTIVRQIPLDIVGDESDDRLSSRGLKDPHTDIAVWQGKNNYGFKQSAWRVCTPPHPNGVAQLSRIDPKAQEYDDLTGRIRLKRTGLHLDHLVDELQADTRKRLSDRKKKMKEDRRNGIYKRNIDYADLGTPVSRGKDARGNEMVTMDSGEKRVSVPAEDYNKYLDEWRRNKMLPIPVSDKSRQHIKMFGWDDRGC